MSIYDQIVSIYPELANDIKSFIDGTIVLQDDSNGSGPYIAKWDHPTLDKPTLNP